MPPLPAATTTRTAETSNNTSSYSGYCSITNPNYHGTVPPRTQTGTSTGCPDANGNEIGNVSRVDHRTLLYPGCDAKILGHFMPWFPHTKYNVGYTSNDVNQVAKQIKDAVERGIQGWIIYYDDRFDPVVDKIKAECERRGDFEFSIQPGNTALSGISPANQQNEMIRLLNLANTKYFSSPRYTRYLGRPLLTFFSMEQFNANLNWVTIRSSINGNPWLIFRNSGAFTGSSTDGVSDGAFAWVNISQAATLYDAASAHPTKIAVAAAARGFDDDLATWGSDRVTPQRNGQFWLDHWAQINQYFSPAFPIHFVQICTWNDWEEGTPVEAGTNNNIALNVQISGTQLTWSVSGGGGIATVHQFKIWGSQDGNNLSLLETVPVTQFSKNLSAYSLPNGTYQIFVQAIGKPSIFNKLSTAQTFVVAGAPVNPPTASASANVTNGIAPLAVNFTGTGTPVGPATIVSYAWDFGDGSFASVQNPSHTYVATGTYQVQLVVTDSNSLTGTASVTITVTTVPLPPPDDIDDSIPKDPLDPNRPICARWRKRKSEIGEQQ